MICGAGFPGMMVTNQIAGLEAGNPSSSEAFIADLQAQNTAQQAFIAASQTRVAEFWSADSG